jgi:hypothetical protein
MRDPLIIRKDPRNFGMGSLEGGRGLRGAGSRLRPRHKRRRGRGMHAAQRARRAPCAPQRGPWPDPPNASAKRTQQVRLPRLIGIAPTSAATLARQIIWPNLASGVRSTPPGAIPLATSRPASTCRSYPPAKSMGQPRRTGAAHRSVAPAPDRQAVLASA